MQILRSISLDFGRKSEYKTVYAKRYEAMNSSLEISLLNYGESFNLESDMTAKMQLLKPDGRLVVAECTENYGGAADKILVEFPVQAFAVPGIGRAEIALYQNGSFLSAQKFYIEIEDNEVADAFSSSNEFRALDEALFQVGTVISSAEEAAGVASTAASNANTAAAAANAASLNANAAASSANNAANAANTAASRVAVMINNANTVISDASQAAGNANAAAENVNEAKDAANTAAGNANAAAATVTAAALGAENVNIAAVQTATGADITTTDRDGVSTTVHIDALFAGDTWSDIINAVRQGFAPQLFPVGYEFTTRDSDTNQDIIWVVRGHDHHQAADSGLTRSMTLETKYVYGRADGSALLMRYDNGEALYYAAEELPAGTYNFTVRNRHSFPNDNGKTFKFTLTNPVPAGGQIHFPGTYNQTFAGQNIRTYASAFDTAWIETAAMSEAADTATAGTNLGITGSGNMNNVERARLGSSNYAQSDVRQWLNSAESAANVWSPRTKFDRASGAALHGFMRGLPVDFVNAVQEAVIPCRTNAEYETNSLDGTEFSVNQNYEVNDKFFLLSHPEIYSASAANDGNVLEYYDGLTNDERRRYDKLGTAQRVFSRTPTGTPGGLCVINPTGSVGANIAHNLLTISPACIIA